MGTGQTLCLTVSITLGLSIGGCDKEQARPCEGRCGYHGDVCVVCPTGFEVCWDSGEECQISGEGLCDCFPDDFSLCRVKDDGQVVGHARLCYVDN